MCICNGVTGGGTHLVSFGTPAAFVLTHVPVTWRRRCRCTVPAVAGEAITESILAWFALALLCLVAQILVNEMCIGSGRSAGCFCLGIFLASSCGHIAVALRRDASGASRTKLVYAFLQTERAGRARFG